ncbi:MAG TPA: hypothetical protein VFA77_07725 [Candidatus Eisenbacteria bacterium]|nr:hypothetical protein [Candidatus Eisenbacteria bacterium]
MKREINNGKVVVIVLLSTMLLPGVVALLLSTLPSSSLLPTSIVVTTSIESDAFTAQGMTLTSVCITATSPTPMTTVPFLHGPLPGTGPMFSDETGGHFTCPRFDYGKGAGAAYIISIPYLHRPSTNVTLRVAFPLQQIPTNSQELYLDAQLVVASIPPVPVHVRLR